MPNSVNLTAPGNRTGLFLLIFTTVFLFGNTWDTVLCQDSKKADPETLKLIRSINDETGKKAGAIIILKDYEMTVNAKGENTLVLRILGKVYDKQALEAYSHIPLGYNSYYEEPVLDYARVIRNDGTIIEVRKDAIQIKTTPDYMGDTKYSDQRFLTFAFSGLETGAAFEYKATFRQKSPVIEGEFFENHYFGGMLQNLAPPYIPRTDPVNRSVYRLKVPKNYEFKYYIQKNPIDPVKTTINNLDVYTWEYSGLQQLKIESSMAPLGNLTPILLISSVKDWSEIDKWASGKLYSGLEITRDLKDKVDGIIRGVDTRDARIKAITAYIRNNIRYIYSDLDRGGYTPHTPIEILNSRYGDCKDQGMLLVSMLKAAGIEAYPALITPYPYDEFISVPAPYFNHLITTIPSEKDTIWIDMTSRVTDYLELPASDRNRNAFIVNSKGGDLVKTPASAASINTASFNCIYEFDKSRCDISSSIETNGLESELMKSNFILAGETDRKEFFGNLVRSYLEGAILDSLTLCDLNNPGETFSADMKFHLDSVTEKGQPSFSFSGLSVIPRVLFSGMESRSMPEKRENDLILEYPYSIRSTEIYNSPENCPLIMTIPGNDSIKNEFFEFRRNFDKDGNKTKVTWELHSEKVIIPKEKYSSFLNEIKKLEEMSTWNVIYVDPITFAGNLNSEDPQSMIRECNDLLLEDSGNIFAMLMKGYFFNKLNKQDSSLSVFSKVLRIDPGNKYAHFWITFPLNSLKRNAEVLTHYEKALIADPAFDEAYIARGAWYMNHKQPEKSIIEFKKAVEADPSNDFAWQAINYYYASQNKTTEAIEYLKEAAMIDSSNIAYEILADICIEAKTYSEAVDAYNKAIARNPGKAVLYGNLAWTYYLQGDFQKCLDYSGKALAIDPKLYYVKFNIALTNLRTGNLEQATKLYGDLKKEKALISESELSGAIEDLKDLKTKNIYSREVEEIIRSFR